MPDWEAEFEQGKDYLRQILGFQKNEPRDSTTYANVLRLWAAMPKCGCVIQCDERQNSPTRTDLQADICHTASRRGVRLSMRRGVVDERKPDPMGECQPDMELPPLTDEQHEELKGMGVIGSVVALYLTYLKDNLEGAMSDAFKSHATEALEKFQHVAAVVYLGSKK